MTGRLFALAAPLALLAAAGALTRTERQEAPRRAIGAISPRISPDGTAAAFSCQGAIWRIPREGGEMRRLTTGRGFDVEPAWSPDGKKIAYILHGSGELRLIDAGTGAPLKVPARVLVPGKLYFHPDGRRLLGHLREGGSQSLAWVDLETGATRPVLNPPRRTPVFALSPAGDEIAYVTTQDLPGEQGGNNGPQADLWIVPSGGGEPRKLVRFRSRIFDLWWGPAGLTASSDLGGAHNDLWQIPPDEPARARRLTSGQADEDGPTTSADGRWLLYTDNRESATALVVRDTKTGEERAIAVGGMDFAAPAGRVRISLVDKSTGRPAVARVSIQHSDGKYAAPPGELYRVHGEDLHFYARGEAEFALPAGTWTLQAFRGIEVKAARQEFAVRPGEASAVRVELERWADPPARGWWSGENHIHANYGYGAWYNTPETMRLQVEGEGLHVANFVVANSDTDGVFDREYFRGEPDPRSSAEHVLYWNEEFRATLWGHMTLVNLKHLVEPVFTGFKDTTNPWDVPTNADVADHTHLQGGHVNYTHPASNPDPFLAAYSAKAMPVDVALGKIDSLDINWSYEPTLTVWYRLLNCGFRLPASAGTDCFLNRIWSRLPGSDRAYVKVEGDFSYGAWVRGLKAGRSFVTNGPMLEVTVDGRSLGETIKLDGPGPVAVSATATYAAPLSRVELVHNGKVVATGRLAPDKLDGTINERVEIERSGWLSVRAFGAGRLQAHTSPVYVEVAGKPAGSREDADYFLRWIDRLEEMFTKRDRVPSEELVRRVRSQIQAAREIYRKVPD